MPSPGGSASRTPSRAVGRLFGLDASQPRREDVVDEDGWDQRDENEAFYESTRRRSTSRSASRSRTPRRSTRRSSTSTQSPNVLRDMWRPPGVQQTMKRTLPPAPPRAGRPLTFDVDALQKDHAIIVDQVIEQLTRGNALSVSSLTLAEPQKFGAIYDQLQAELERVLDAREAATPADAARARDVQHIVAILFSLVEHERSSFLFSMSSLRETVKRREGRLASRAQSELSQGLQRRLAAGAALLTALTRTALEERPLRRAWGRWRLAAARAAAAARCAALEIALRFATGQSDEAALSAEKQRQKLLQRVASRWRNMEKHCIFDRWNEYRRERVYVRALAKRVMLRMVNGKVASAYTSWRLVVKACKEAEAETKRQEVILQRVRAKWLLGSLCRVVVRWRELVAERKHMRSLVKKVVGQLMNWLSGSAFRTWSSNARTMKDEQEEATRQAIIFERIRKRWLNQATGAAYRSWREFVAERQRVRALVKKVVGQLMHGLEGSAFRQWTAFVEALDAERRTADAARAEEARMQGILDTVRRRWLQSGLNAAFRRWAEFWGERRQLRALATKTIQQMLHNRVLPAFNEWRDAVAFAKKAEVILERVRRRWLNGALCKTLARWTEFLVEIKRMRQLVRKVVGQLLHGLSGSAFRSWRSTVDKLKRREHAAQLDKCRQLEAQLQAIEQARIQSLMARVALRLRNGGLLKVWGRWEEMVYDRKRLRALMHRAIHNFLHGEIAPALRSWARFSQDQARAEQEALRSEATEAQEAVRREAILAKVRGSASNNVDGDLRRATARRTSPRPPPQVRARWLAGAAHKALTAWVHMTRERKRLRTLATKVFGRLVNGKVHAGFATWRDGVAAEKRYTAICARFGARMRLQATAKALAAWRENAADRRRLRRLVQHAVAKFASGKLSPALSQWRAAALTLKLEAREVQRQHTVLDRMRRRMLNRCAFSALRAWEAFVVERRRTRDLARRVFNRLLRGKVAAAFEQWASVLREEKEGALRSDRVHKLMRRIALRLKNAGLLGVWGSWEEFVWERRKLRTIVLRLASGRAASAFSTWRDGVVADKRHRTILERFGKRLRFACAAKALGTWRDFRSERKRARALMAHVLARLKHANLGPAFRTWNKSAEDARRLERVGHRVLVMLTRGCAKRCFGALRDDCAHQKRLRELVTRAMHQMKQGTLGRGWRCWRETVVCGRARDAARDVGARRLALLRVCRFVRHALATRFSTWRRGSTVAVSRAYGDYQRREEHWREKRALQMWTGNVAGRCFEAWRAVVRTDRRERVALYRHGLRVNKRVRLDVFTRWDRLRRDRRLARSVLKKLLHVAVAGTTAQALHMWRDQALDERRHEAVLGRVRRRWLQRTSSRSFERWREYVLVRKHVKMVALHVLQRLAHSNILPAFAAWRSQIKRMVHCDHLVANALVRMRHALAARAFVSWVRRWEDFKRRNDLLTHVLAKLLHSKLVPGFRKLVAYALDADRRLLERRAGERLLRRVVGAFEHAKLLPGLQTWKRFTRGAAEAEERTVRQDVILDRCRRRMRNLLVGRSLAQWIYYSRDRRRLRTLAKRIVKRMHHVAYFPALASWKAFVARERHLRQVVHKVVGQLRHGLTGAAFRTWAATARAAVAREHTAVAHAVIVDRCRRRWLQQSVARALAAWCFMAAERARLRGLVKRALGRMRSSELGRGFRLWARAVHESRANVVRDAAHSAKTAARYWFDAAELRNEHALRRRAFGALQQLRRRRAQNRSRAARWARALGRRRTRGVFGAWRLSSRDQKRRALQVPGKLRAALRVAHDECARQARRGFSVWLHAVDAARLDDARRAARGASRLHRLDKALVAIEYTQYQLVRKVFVAWVDLFLHKRRCGRLTAFVGVALARATLTRAYHAWGRYVDGVARARRTLKRALHAKHATNTRRAFSRWHAYSASLPSVGADFFAGFAVPPPPCDSDDEDPRTPPPGDFEGHLYSSGPSYASTPTTAQPYFDDPGDPAGTLYESPVGRAVEY